MKLNHPPNDDDPNDNKYKKNVLLLSLSTKSFSENTKWMETISDTRSKYNAFDALLIPHLDNTLSKNQTILSSLKSKLPSPVFYQEKTFNSQHYLNHEKSHESFKTNSRRIEDYPPSKPMHRRIRIRMGSC